MNDSATLEKPKELRPLLTEIRDLQKQLAERIEELEDRLDLLELQGAVKENEGKPYIPWETVKAEFDVPSSSPS